MWSLPMDIAPEYSGTATGLMCVGGSLGALLSPITTGFLIDQTGSWKMPFLIVIILLLVGTVLAFFMHPHHAFQSRQQRRDVEKDGVAAVLPEAS